MSTSQSFSTGVASQIGSYADAVRVPAGYAQVHVSGTPGLTQDGALPAEFAEEARQAWRNVVAALEAAGSCTEDIVSVHQWLIDSQHIADYSAVRSEFVKHQPASMMAVVDQLVWPAVRVEVEVIAAVPPTRASSSGT